MENLEERLCTMIINRCRLIDIDADSCDYDAPLFITDDEDGIKGGFELDSVDALEIVAGLKGEFGITINVKDMAVLRNINTLSAYIREHEWKEQ